MPHAFLAVAVVACSMMPVQGSRIRIDTKVNSLTSTTNLETRLCLAIRGNRLQEVQELLNKEGVDPNKIACGRDRWHLGTPLQAASAEGHDEVVELLLNKEGVDPNKADRFGWTPLHAASGSFNEEGNYNSIYKVVELLLEKEGVDPNKADKKGQTPLHLAAAREEPTAYKVVELLLKAGVDPDKADDDGKTPLHIASEQGNYEVVRRLVKEATPNALDNDGWTPLHFAADSEADDYKAVELLLNKEGVDPNKADKDGYTPLHAASWWGNYKVAELLLKTGVDPNQATKFGQTPLEIAREEDHAELVKLFEAPHGGSEEE